MKRNSLIVKRRYIQGGGFKDDMIRYANGVGTKVQYKIIDGVKRLVPVGFDGLKYLSNAGLDKLQDIVTTNLNTLQPAKVTGSGMGPGLKLYKSGLIRDVAKNLGRKTGAGLIRSY
jgi:hypothetical protein